MNDQFDLERFKAGEPAYRGNSEARYIGEKKYAKTEHKYVAEYVNHGTIFMFDVAGASQFGECLIMRPKLKQIDWSKMPVDTLLTIEPLTGKQKRYFSSFSDEWVHYFTNGKTSKTADYKYEIYKAKPKNFLISPEQQWSVWRGGECPIPNGLEFEVVFRCGNNHISSDYPYTIYWDNSGKNSDVIAYRLTGKVLDGWTL